MGFGILIDRSTTDGHQEWILGSRNQRRMRRDVSIGLKHGEKVRWSSNACNIWAGR